MKKKMFVMILMGILCYLGGFTAPSYAASIDSLEDKEFMVFMFCDDDAGDYCSEEGIVMEEFIFEDDDKFYLDTFEDQGIGSGNYEENGIFFEAEFEAIEDLIKHYQFDITGLNILDGIILGVNEVSYEYLIKFDDEDANCYFIGFSK